ncbi:HAD-IA family hydrolase [Glutamicibacter sp. TV12E]|uniref:HAD-IA family hydrolase n=1 Tax=Glutamicibacter sp. TV12E TaxID=3446362 RepID=UPI004033BBF7
MTITRSWTAKGLLFDLDGTLVDSHQEIASAWTTIANKHSLSVDNVLALLPGRRANEILRSLNIADDEIETDLHWLERKQNNPGQLDSIAGAHQLLKVLPPESWAVVTAAPKSVALARLDAAKLPRPQVLVAAEDVEHGKPAPDGYLLAAQLLGFSPKDCVVFEDAQVGVDAALAAGSRVISIGTLVGRSEQSIQDYRQLQIESINLDAISWNIPRKDSVQVQ